MVSFLQLLNHLLYLLFLSNKILSFLELFLKILLMLPDGLLNLILHHFPMVLELSDLVGHLFDLVEIFSEIWKLQVKLIYFPVLLTKLLLKFSDFIIFFSKHLFFLMVNQVPIFVFFNDQLLEFFIFMLVLCYLFWTLF